MTGKLWFLHLIVLILQSNSLNGWRPFKIIFTSTEGSTTDLASLKSWVGKSRLDNTALFVDYEIGSRLDHLMVNIVLKQAEPNMYPPFYLRSTFNVCDSFKNNKFSPLVRAIYLVTTAHTDMPLKCPIEKRIYHIKELGDVEEQFPPYFPINSYKLTMLFYSPLKGRNRNVTTLIIKFKTVSNHWPKGGQKG